MLSNVIAMDYEATTVSLIRSKGAIVLFDFRAAFPIISHAYLSKAWARLALYLVEGIYDRNRCVVSCVGAHFDGFPMKAGIRQGCPLSPLPFAVVVDMLLRQLSRRIPTGIR